MHGVDRRLDLVDAGLVAPQAVADDRLALGDQCAVPAVPILVGERHEVAAGGRPGRAARLDEQHQREQPQDLRLVGHELGEQPAETDGLGAQVGADELRSRAGRVALVEDEVDDGQHGLQPAGEVGRGGDAVRDLARRGSCPWPGPAAAPWSAPAPGRPRAISAVVSPPSSRSVSATCARAAERRVAAGEDQPQPLVVHRPLLHRLVARRAAGPPARAGRRATPPGAAGRSPGCGRW